MKRLILIVSVLALGGLATMAMAGDYHTGKLLVCSDCHVAHYSQAHGYSVGGTSVPMGGAGPYDNLLRNEPNELCLTCHDNNSIAPDVLGDNTGNTAGSLRQAGALNATGHGFGDAGYDQINGHTLWSTDVAPGGTFTNAVGLECINCHSQHGSATQYRNLLNRGIFGGPPSGTGTKSLTYAITTNDLTKDVFERNRNGYIESDIDFNEPTTTKSAYGAWCSACHTNFHGSGGAANMGGASGGFVLTNVSWKRHPTADVNIGGAKTDSMTFVSSLAQYASRGNKVKVMDSQGLWTGVPTDNTVSPSCFSCHKGHGNKNAFGLIFMSGTGTRSEQGDDGDGPSTLRSMCRQCHSQGA